ncbi:phosphatidylinositol 4-kinase gamma 4-like [Silene latifolia]|uniref:phosphatidylinositol 4-kinase gamma 4-like n=1 Tax=Silene latifolia TaxID=37657 RepID=UPI003D776965
MSSAALVVTRTEESVGSPRFYRSALDLDLNESIYIEVNAMGNTFRAPLQVFKYESVESVKLKIQISTGFVVKNQKLVYGGRELSRCDSLVRDYDVSNGDVFHIVVKLTDLQAIKVRTVCGKELSFCVGRFQDVGSVKKKIAKEVKELDGEDGHELIYKGEQLDDQKKINDIVKHGDHGVILLIIRKSAKVRFMPVGKDFELSVDASDVVSKKYEYGCDLVPAKDFLVPVFGNPKSDVPTAILDVIAMTKDGLANGHFPIMSTEGSGGAYLMLDSTGSEYVSVFKPIDEEPKAMNNPRGLPLTAGGEGLKRGTRVGEGAFREVAAYLLDHPINGRRGKSGEAIGFSGVPPTGMVKCLHEGFNHPNGINEKYGSLQKFMKNNGSCEDIGPGAFPVEEVHKISVLDMRLANADRHSGNILFSKNSETGRTTLIPIDHGYCLPESFEDCTFDWLYWPQAKQPYSREAVEYIKSLDAKEDIALLKFYGWDMSVDSARTLRISTMLLKKGVERGWTPYAIGSIMCRETVRKKSVIEEIVQEALEAVLPAISEVTFMETVSQIMDRRLNEISK